jgi:hypothetical protein
MIPELEALRLKLGSDEFQVMALAFQIFPTFPAQ